MAKAPKDESTQNASSEPSVFTRMQQLVRLHEQGLLDAHIETTFLGEQSSGQNGKGKKIKPPVVKRMAVGQLRVRLVGLLHEDNAQELMALMQEQTYYFERPGVLKQDVFHGMTLWEKLVSSNAYECAKTLLESGFDPQRQLTQKWASDYQSPWIEVMRYTIPSHLNGTYDEEGAQKEEKQKAQRAYIQRAQQVLKESLQNDGYVWVDEKGVLSAVQIPGGRKVLAGLWTLPNRQVLKELGVEHVLSDSAWEGVEKSTQVPPMVKLLFDTLDPELFEVALIQQQVRCTQAYQYLCAHVSGGELTMHSIAKMWEGQKGKSEYALFDVLPLSLKMQKDEPQLHLARLQHQLVHWLWLQQQNTDGQAQVVAHCMQAFDALQKHHEQQQQVLGVRPQLVQKVPHWDHKILQDVVMYASVQHFGNEAAHDDESEREQRQRAHLYVQQLGNWWEILSASKEGKDVSIWQCMPARTIQKMIIDHMITQRMGGSERSDHEKQLMKVLLKALKAGMQIEDFQIDPQQDYYVRYNFWCNEEQIEGKKIALPAYLLQANKMNMAKLLWSDPAVRRQMLEDEQQLWWLSRLTESEHIQALQKWGVPLESLVDPATCNNVFHNRFSHKNRAEKTWFEEVKKYPTLLWQMNKEGKTPVDLLDLDPKQQAQWIRMQAQRIKEGVKKQVVKQVIDADGQVQQVTKTVLAGGRKKAGSGLKRAL